MKREMVTKAVGEHVLMANVEYMFIETAQTK